MHMRRRHLVAVAVMLGWASPVLAASDRDSPSFVCFTRPDGFQVCINPVQVEYFGKSVIQHPCATTIHTTSNRDVCVLEEEPDVAAKLNQAREQKKLTDRAM